MYGRRAPWTSMLVGALKPGDSLISTNWDLLLDRCLVARWRSQHGRKWLTSSPIRYHCVGERPVNWRGNDLHTTTENPQSLLRLHGALNWFGCTCCGTVYVNLDGSYVLDDEDPRDDYDECHCGARLMNILIAPSYLKDYRNVSLRSVWREAQKRLEAAERWVFIGYSLPSDDFHIRAMLMRALRSGSSRRTRRMPIDVFLGPRSQDAANRYKALFNIAKPQVEMTGFAGWAKKFA